MSKYLNEAKHGNQLLLRLYQRFPFFLLHFTFKPRSYLRTLLVSPAALALEMAVLYISIRSNRLDSNPVAPLGAAGGEEWDVTLTLGAVGVTAGGVGAGACSSSSSKTSLSSAYIWRHKHVYSSGEKSYI